MKLNGITDYLASTGVGDIGQTLFQDFMPHDIPVGLLVVAQTPIGIDKYTGIRKGNFQVIARGRTEDEAYDLAKRASEALCSYGLTLGDIRFYHILPEHEPMVFPMPDSEMIEASVVFDIVFANIGV